MSTAKSSINIENKYDRIILLVDMDCFYCQVEEKLNPELKNKPIAVVQYNEWKGGGIIAVNYPARSAGVSRHMRGDEAKEHCPDIILCKVPNVRGKADLSKYRDAGKEVAQVLLTFTPLLERASVDEAYLDITESVHMKLQEMNNGKYKLDAKQFSGTHAIGYYTIANFVQEVTNRCGAALEDSPIFENESEYEKTALKRSDLKLLIAAAIANDIRAAVKETTGYDCSAGIAHNKILAKLTAGMHKPNQQTLLPVRSIPELYATLPISKVKGLGGKFGEEVCDAFKIKFMSQLSAIPKENLLKRFDEKNGTWLYLISRGVDLEHVQCRYTAKSIACCKRFPGKSAIIGIASLNHWLLELSTEICERMEKDSLENNRKAKQMTVSFTQTLGSDDIPSSRTVPLNCYDPQSVAKEALAVIKRNTSQFCKSENQGSLNNHIKFLGISVSKFEDQTKSTTLKDMFEKQLKKTETLEASSSTNEQTQMIQNIDNEDSETTLSEIMDRKIKIKPIEVAIETKDSILEDMFEKQLKKTETLKASSSMNNKIENMRKNNDVDSETTLNEIMAHGSTSSNYSSSLLTNNIEQSGKFDDDSQNEEFIRQTIDSTKVESHEDIILSEIEPELMQCKTCKRQLPEDEMPAHTDYHFALSISQKQREEFREAKKLKFSPPINTSNKKIKKRSTLSSINNFFKKDFDKKEEEESNEDAIKCEECGKMVNNILEHSDYHLAKKLQQEINGNSSTSLKLGNGTKRKRSQSRSDKTEQLKFKPLTSFFTKDE